MARYADTPTAEQYVFVARIRYQRCDRCGKPVHPWPIKRSDTCSPNDWEACIRDEDVVAQGWEKSRQRNAAMPNKARFSRKLRRTIEQENRAND